MNDFNEGVQPENDLKDVDYDPRPKLRAKALILLLCLVIPTILVVVEITTGLISQALQPVVPYLHKVWAF
jgi:hypothetical protein